MFLRTIRFALFVLLLPALAGCGMMGLGTQPSAPNASRGLRLPASVVVDNGQGGAMQLEMASLVVGGGPMAAGFGSRGFSMGGSGAPKHDGVDIVAASGTPVRAGADGRIEDVGWRGAYGRFVLIRHSDRIETAYAHLSRFVDGLAVGQSVRRDDIIGYVGTTGNATGPHLHYEVRRNGKAVDPLGGYVAAQAGAPAH
jgi:murein DD-endopeptidase MepM/ murein hydrolase activator NlpD